MFYLMTTIDPLTGTEQQHIIEPLEDGGIRSWPLTDDNPNKPRLDAWLAEGNTPEEWNPDAD